MALTIFLLCLLTVSAVSASDNSTGDIVSIKEDVNNEEVLNVEKTSVSENEEIYAYNGTDTVLQQENDNNKLGVSDEPTLGEDTGSFNDLKESLKDILNGVRWEDQIELGCDYTYVDGEISGSYGFTFTNEHTKLVIIGNGHIIDGIGKIGLFDVQQGHVEFRNIVFKNGHVDENGGALKGNCTAVNCTFIGNYAGGAGGAIDNGYAIDCIFRDNHADTGNGGGVNNGIVENCEFINNSAYNGGAFAGTIAKNSKIINCTGTEMGGGMINGSAENCTFISNYADRGGAIAYCDYALNCMFIANYAVGWSHMKDDFLPGGMYQGLAINCTFINNTGPNKAYATYLTEVVLCTFINNELSQSHVTPARLDAVDSTVNLGEEFLFNITYENEGLSFKSVTLTGVNTSITVYNKNNETIGTYYCLSGSWDLNLTPGDYDVELSVVDHSEVAKVRVSLKVLTSTTIVAPENILLPYGHDYVIRFVDAKNRSLSGFELSIDLNGVENYTTDENGEVIIKTNDLKPGEYSVNITFRGDEYYSDSTFNTNIIIDKESCKLTMDPVEIVYDSNQELTITLTDSIGNPINNVTVSVELNGVKNYTTDENGQFNVSTSDLIPGTYYVNITFEGNDVYNKTLNNIEVVVKSESTEFDVKDIVTDYNVPKEIVISLKDNLGNPLNNLSVSVELNGVENYTTDENGQIKLSTEGLLPDNYQVNITFAGNELYTKSNATFKITINKVGSTLKVNSVITFYNADDELVVNLNDGKGNPVSNANVSVDLNGVKNHTTDDAGNVRLSCEGLLPGSYPVSVAFEGNEIYLPSNVTSSVFIMRVFSVFYLNELVTDYNDAKIFVISLKDVYGNPLRNVSVSVEWSDVGRYDTDENGELRLSCEGLLPGSYPVSVAFEGNDIYLPASAASNIVINKFDSVLNVNNLAIVYGEDGELVISLKDVGGIPLCNVSVCVDLNGDANYTTDDMGELHVSCEDLLPGSYQVTVAFEGNDIYLPASATSSVFIMRVFSVFYLNELVTDYNDTKIFVISLKDVYGNPLSFVPVYVEWADVGRYYTNENGEICLSSEDLLPGTYQVNVTFEGNEKYLPASATSKIVINKLDSVLNVTNLTVDYGDDGVVVISLKDVFGNPLRLVPISVDGFISGMYATDENGELRLSCEDLLPRTYLVNVSFEGNEKYLPSNATSEIIINKLNSVLNANNLTAVYDEDEQFIINLKDINGNPLSNVSLSVDLNGVSNYTTDDNGEVRLSCKNLLPGTYLVNVAFNGNKIYLPSIITANIAINKLSTLLNANNIEIVYGASDNLVITLNDEKGNPLSGVSISVDLNSVNNYNTDVNGQIIIPIQNFAPKNYVATITFSGDNCYIGSSITSSVVVKKATPKLTAKSKTFKKSQKVKKYVVSLKNNQNKVMKNTKVKVKVNKKVYTAKTNSKGYATFKITKLSKKGKFTAYVKYAGSKYYNSKTVKAKILVK